MGGGSKGKAWEDGGTRGMEREEREERVVVVQRCELCMVVYVECAGKREHSSFIHSASATVFRRPTTRIY